MNKKEFVDLIKLTVVKSIPSDINLVLGENKIKKNPDLLKLSQWYMRLSDDDKGMIKEIIKMAADSCTFHFLCVLDGVSVIDNDEVKGELELYYVKNEKRYFLNENKGEYLHDIYNSI